MEEEWRLIPEYEGCYEISNLARIKSLDRIVGHSFRPRLIKGRILEATINNNGYMVVTLYKHGKGKTFDVHALMCRIFLGDRPDGMVIRHLDGNPSNNIISNLCYGTPSENNLDSVKHGTHKESRKTHCPWKHKLAGANLVPAGLKRGKRQCRACQNARNYIRNHGGDFQSVSDDYYNKIMEKD